MLHLVCYILLPLFLLSSCNKVLFENPMPVQAEPISDLPEHFSGDYLSFNDSAQAITAFYMSVTRGPSFEHLIQYHYVSYLDSLELIEKGIATVDTLFLLGDSIIAIGENQIRLALHVHDTSTSDTTIWSYSIDLRKGTCFDTWYNMKLERPTEAACMCRQEANNYYLNINYLDSFWLVQRIQSHPNKIQLTNMYFDERDDSTGIHELVVPYGLQRIPPPKRVKADWHYYKAPNNDQQFRQLIDEPFFHTKTWYKIQPANDWSRWLSFAYWLLLLPFYYGYRAFKLKKINSPKKSQP